MARNTALKVAFIETDTKQIDAAARLRALGLEMDDTKLSKIVNGHIEATPEEQEAIAKLLDRPKRRLFPKAVAV